MQVVLPEERLPIRLAFDPELPMSDDEYYEFCMTNPDVRFERTSGGEIIIVPPCGWESDHQSGEAFRQLANWAKRDGRGKASGMSTEFILPTGAAFSPDAAWVSNERLSKLTKQQLRKFPHLAPEFVIEVMSPTDRLKSAKEKMKEWLRGGVDLAWLIHPDEKAVYIYRASESEPEKRENPARIPGEGPVAGFELELTEIWCGL